jgi:hypothetical protein
MAARPRASSLTTMRLRERPPVFTRSTACGRYTVAASSATNGNTLEATVPITLPPRGRQ